MSTLQVYDISTGGGSMASALRSQGGRGAARTLHRACCPHLARASATLTGRRKEATLEHEDVTTIIYYRRRCVGLERWQERGGWRSRKMMNRKKRKEEVMK